MSKGRQAQILGRKMVINLNTKGGVRRSPGANKYAKCWAKERKAGKNPYDAAAACKGTKG